MTRAHTWLARLFSIILPKDDAPDVRAFGKLPAWATPRRLVIPFSPQDGLWKRFLLRLAAVAAFLHLAVGWTQQGFHQCDEHFQILEWVGVLQGHVARESLAWEYGAHIRSWLQPVLLWALVEPLRMAGLVETPFGMANVMRMSMAAAGWASSMGVAVACGRWFEDGRRRRVAAVLLLCLSTSLFLHARTSGENLSQTFFHTAVVALVLLPEGTAAGALAGGLLGLAFFARFQTGFLVAGLGLWTLFHGTRRAAATLGMAAGFLLVGLACVGVDWWGYGELQWTAWNYFKANILEHGAAGFGESPWWAYPQLFAVELPGLGGLFILLLGVAAWFRFPSHMLTWASVPFVLGHMAIGHKEARFLLPVLGTFLVLGGALLADAWTWMERMRPAWQGRARLAAVALVLLDVVTTVRLQIFPKPSQFLVLKDVYERLPNGGTLFTMGHDPYGVCGHALEFYRPPGLVMVHVASMEDALAHAGGGLALVHRMLKQEPVEGQVGQRCQVIRTTRSVHMPAIMARTELGKALLEVQRVDQLMECR